MQKEKGEEYESWRFWAKAHLITKRKKNELGIIENEEELVEKVTILGQERSPMEEGESRLAALDLCTAAKKADRHLVAPS